MIRAIAVLATIAFFVCPEATHAAPQNRALVAVADLKGVGFTPNDVIVVSEEVRSQLSHENTFRIIERSQMESILKEQGFQQSGCTDEACAVQAGQLLGVKYMIIGTLGKAGDYSVLSIRMLDVSTGEVLVSESGKTTGGINAMIATGISEVCTKTIDDYRALSNQLPPVKAATDVKKSGPLPFIVGGGLILAGGAAAWLFLLPKKHTTTPSSSTPMTELEITLQ